MRRIKRSTNATTTNKQQFIQKGKESSVVNQQTIIPKEINALNKTSESKFLLAPVIQNQDQELKFINKFSNNLEFLKDLPASDFKTKHFLNQRNVVDNDLKFIKEKPNNKIQIFPPVISSREIKKIQYNHFLSGKQRFLIKSVSIEAPRPFMEQPHLIFNTSPTLQFLPFTQLPDLIQTSRLSHFPNKNNLLEADILLIKPSIITPTIPTSKNFFCICKFTIFLYYLQKKIIILIVTSTLRPSTIISTTIPTIITSIVTLPNIIV